MTRVHMLAAAPHRLLFFVGASTRALAEVLPDSPAWQAIAGAGWIVAFLPWVLRSGRIYLSARVDGRPG